VRGPARAVLVCPGPAGRGVAVGTRSDEVHSALPDQLEVGFRVVAFVKDQGDLANLLRQRPTAYQQLLGHAPEGYRVMLIVGVGVIQQPNLPSVVTAGPSPGVVCWWLRDSDPGAASRSYGPTEGRLPSYVQRIESKMYRARISARENAGCGVRTKSSRVQPRTTSSKSWLCPPAT
jgi:hypothetical protein